MNRCIIRRTQALLSKYLPVKYEMVVVCSLTDMQRNIYESFVTSDTVRRSLKGETMMRINFLGRFLRQKSFLQAKMM